MMIFQPGGRARGAGHNPGAWVMRKD